MRRKWKNVQSGEWVQPIRKGYRMACCDCGLVHRMNFRIHKEGAKHYIQMQAFRDERSTAALRREKKRQQAAATPEGATCP
jgi:hypothetical protein